MKISMAEIQQDMRAAGWPEDLIVTGAAVFMFESGGRTDAHNPGNPIGAEDSWGLAQINIKPSLRRPWTAYQLIDPVFNLTIAYQLYQVQGWHAWENTYYKGRYKQYMPESQRVYNGGDYAGDNTGNYTDDFGSSFINDASGALSTLGLDTTEGQIIGAVAGGLGVLALLSLFSD